MTTDPTLVTFAKFVSFRDFCGRRIRSLRRAWNMAWSSGPTSLP